MTTIYLSTKHDYLDSFSVVGHRNTVSKQWHEALVLDYPTTTFKLDRQADQTLTVRPTDIIMIIENS